MADTSLIPESQRLVDAVYIAGLTGLSNATIWRHHDAGVLPLGLKIGRSVRWRLRTGDPLTGILDWIEAGCPSRKGDGR